MKIHCCCDDDIYDVCNVCLLRARLVYSIAPGVCLYQRTQGCLRLGWKWSCTRVTLGKWLGYVANCTYYCSCSFGFGAPFGGRSRRIRIQQVGVLCIASCVYGVVPSGAYFYPIITSMRDRMGMQENLHESTTVVILQYIQYIYARVY